MVDYVDFWGEHGPLRLYFRVLIYNSKILFSMKKYQYIRDNGIEG